MKGGSRELKELKAVALVMALAALALLAGCASPGSGGPQAGAYVSISGKVDAYDPDGLLFDLMVSTRQFDPGAVSRGPLAQVVVTAPAALAGRKYLIALPDEAEAGAGEAGGELRKRGADVVFELPRKLVDRGQREIIDLAELRWPAPGPASFRSGRGGEIRTHDLYVPNVALYQAKLRPDPWAGSAPE